MSDRDPAARASTASGPAPVASGGVAPGGGPAILVHGGAGRHPAAAHEAVIDAVRRAVDAGWAVLEAGGSALDAVEAATRVLEDEPLLDAGVGSHLTTDGDVEVDAIVVDGAALDFGAVAAVPRVAHPVTLARRVLDASPHALLVGAGAERFARRLGLTVPAASLVTEAALRRWRRGAASPDGGPRPGGAPTPDDAAPETGDTVGAVALDARGHVAAATSTGGTRGKWPGRVGDSPIPGAGAWADDAGGAVSATGEGEAILRVGLSHAVGAALRGGAPPERAAADGVALLAARTGGVGGLIALDARGGLGWARSTREMPVAWRSRAGRGDAL